MRDDFSPGGNDEEPGKQCRYCYYEKYFPEVRIVNGIRQQERAENNNGDDHYRNEIRKERFCFARNVVFVNGVIQKQWNGDGFKNNGFK